MAAMASNSLTGISKRCRVSSDATVQFTPLIVGLAVVGIIYGALVAMVQPDMKKLVAYSSVSHLGFVVLGIFALSVQSISGGIIQMVNHGLSTGALFLLVGIIYQRTHTRQIADYGGLASQMPRYAVVFLIVALASVGLPGLNGFVGEFLIIVGSFQSQPIAAISAIVPSFRNSHPIGLVNGSPNISWKTDCR